MTNSTNPLDIIAAPPPAVPESVVLDLLAQQYGLTGSLVSLVSERDQNFRLSATNGQTLVVKIANSAEPELITEFQILALMHLEENTCVVPVPRIIRTKAETASTTISTAGSSHVLRLVSYLPGRPVEGTVPGPKLAHTLGQNVARLDEALSDFTHPGESQVLLWDMQRAGELRDLIKHVTEPDLQELVFACLDAFEANAEPAFAGLRSQVIHNDLNSANVLIDDADPPGVAGVIDFGDMVRAPLIVDIAIAASYLRSTDDALELTRALIAGFDAVTPLEDTERALLFDLVRMRLATTVTILHWRQTARSSQDPYLQQSLQESDAERFLWHLTALTREGFFSRIFDEKN